MTILFGGGEDTEIDITTGSMVTTPGSFRAGYARAAMAPVSPGGGLGAGFLLQHRFSGALATYLAAQAAGDKDFWYGYRWSGGGGFLTGLTALTIYDSSGSPKPFMRLVSIGTGDTTLQLSTDGFVSNVQNHPSSSIGQPGTPTEYTFRIKIHATLGQIQWWVNGGLWYQTVLGDTTGLCVGSPSKVLWTLPNSNGNCYVSEVIATSADDPRVGMSLVTLAYTANGANVGWTGGVASINEITEDQSTLLTAAAALLESSFIATDLPTLASGVAVRAVINSGHWRTAVGAPQSVAGYLRIAGVNYAAASQLAPSVASTLQFIWQLSPATGITFTEAAVNAAEFGMRSIA